MLSDIAAGKLESEGIPVFLLGINHASANWLLSNALGGIRLQVRARYVDDARQLLEQMAKLPDSGPVSLNARSVEDRTRRLRPIAGRLLSWQYTCSAFHYRGRRIVVIANLVAPNGRSQTGMTF